MGCVTTRQGPFPKKNSVVRGPVAILLDMAAPALAQLNGYVYRYIRYTRRAADVTRSREGPPRRPRGGSRRGLPTVSREI